MTHTLEIHSLQTQRSQYAACSRGKVNFAPATGTSNSHPGVVELHLSQSVNGVRSGTVKGYVNNALSTVNGGMGYNQVMYVLPQAVAFNRGKSCHQA